MPTCNQCQSDFQIDAWDREFYDKISPIIAGEKFQIPEPKLCPLCRAQKRYTWRGELHLFKRKSAFSGKDLITFYPPEAKCKVYSNEEWWSDHWDPLNYGKEFDFKRPFFEQFQELVETVPLLALSCSANAENTEYINCASWNRNCYLIAGANYNEDCYYGNYINRSKDCVDNNFIDSCELCYECINCTNCFELKYSQNCQSCSKSFFLHSCRNCHECLGSVNLVNKQYYFFNQALSKEAYETKLASLELHKHSNVQKMQILFERHRIKYPHKFMIGDMNEDVSGNAIHHSRNAFDCFDASELWDCRYCSWFHQSKNCMDVISWGFPAELCYECTEVGDGANHVLFSVSSYGAHETFYSYYSMYSKRCFGCVSMRRNEYCILNKQYSPVEYEKMLVKIIRHMQNTGEWGEFFPIRLSPLSYNTSIAQDYFPLDRDAAISLGLKWHDYVGKNNSTVKTSTIPDSIDDVGEDICEKVFLCENKNISFKITPQEYKFYKKMKISIPRVSFNARHEARLTKRNPRQLWDRTCAKCMTEIKSSYPPYKPEIVYCEKCYLAEVY